jgi:hypothetical protein
MEPSIFLVCGRHGDVRWVEGRFFNGEGVWACVPAAHFHGLFLEPALELVPNLAVEDAGVLTDLRKALRRGQH